MKSKNTSYWDTENFHVNLLCDQKVGIWCTANCKQIINPTSSYDTVILEQFVYNILEPFTVK